MAKPKAKAKAKAPAKQSKQPRVVLIAAFADAPDAKALIAHYEAPADTIKRGFYFVRSGQAEWLFEKHREKKVPAKVAQAGFALLRALMDDDGIRAKLGGDSDCGYHADLDARALEKAFVDEGFSVERYEIPPLVGIMYGPSDPWPAALQLLQSGDVETKALLDALVTHDNLRPPPAAFMSLVAKKLESRDELTTLRRMLESAKADLTACALPLVARVWKPKKAKGKPRDLPAELTTLLSAFDGIPALGVMNAKDIAARLAYFLRLAKDANGIGKRDWGDYTPKEIRIDRFWRDSWIPFCTRPDDQTLAIDLLPTSQGKRGQVIGVHLNPPTLRCYRPTLGEWLWNELEGAWR